MAQQEGFGIIHLFHELSHIYYFEKIGTNLDSLKKKYNTNQDFMESSKSFGLIMWEEYFVSRYLCPYLFGSTDCYIDILGEQYKIIKRDLEEAIKDYRYSANIDELYKLCVKYPSYKKDLLKRIRKDKIDKRLEIVDYMLENNIDNLEVTEFFKLLNE